MALKPTPLTDPPAEITGFQEALLSRTLWPLWVQDALHACVIIWLPGHANASCHPLICVAPVFAIATEAVMPLPQSLLTLYATRQLVTPPPGVGVDLGVPVGVGVGLGVDVGVADELAAWMLASIRCFNALTGVES